MIKNVEKSNYRKKIKIAITMQMQFLKNGQIARAANWGEIILEADKEQDKIDGKERVTTN